jgi:molecular chaperone DnaJ
MAKRDFYEVLGVSRERVRGRAEERLSQARHAVSPGPQSGRSEAEAKFKEVNEAYETLKDPQKRAAYDRFGHAAFENGGMGGGGGGGFGAAGGFSDIFEDIFGEMMGGGGVPAGAAAASAAPICATIWRSRSKRPMRARRRRSACRPR